MRMMAVYAGLVPIEVSGATISGATVFAVQL